LTSETETFDFQRETRPRRLKLFLESRDRDCIPSMSLHPQTSVLAALVRNFETAGTCGASVLNPSISLILLMSSCRLNSVSTFILISLDEHCHSTSSNALQSSPDRTLAGPQTEVVNCLRNTAEYGHQQETRFSTNYSASWWLYLPLAFLCFQSVINSRVTTILDICSQNRSTACHAPFNKSCLS